MSNRNDIYIIIIGIVLLITVASGITFAYIGKATSTGETNIGGTITDFSNKVSFTYSEYTDLSLTISKDDLSMTEASNDYTSFISSKADVTIELATASGFDTPVVCTYDIKYIPTVVYNRSDGATLINKNELTLSTIGANPDVYDYSLNGINSEVTLLSSSIRTSDTNKYIAQTITFEMRFYNLNIAQDSVYGKKPSGKIKIVPTGCEVVL